jgi:hypothetical protein
VTIGLGNGCGLAAAGFRDADFLAAPFLLATTIFLVAAFFGAAEATDFRADFSPGFFLIVDSYWTASQILVGDVKNLIARRRASALDA